MLLLSFKYTSIAIAYILFITGLVIGNRPAEECESSRSATLHNGHPYKDKTVPLPPMNGTSCSNRIVLVTLNR